LSPTILDSTPDTSLPQRRNKSPATPRDKLAYGGSAPGSEYPTATL
jgi:hypothetical protein